MSKGDTGFRQPAAWSARPDCGPMGGGEARPAFETTHRAPSANKAPLVWRAPEGPEGLTAGPWAAAGPGCGARRRRQGLAGLRDRPLRAAGSRVAISRAGRRPRAHKAARPHRRALRRQEHPWGHKQHTQEGRRAERSSRRGRRAGGPPPTGTHSGRARQRPEHQRRSEGITRPRGGRPRA